MKKFKFNLEAVLRYREKIEEYEKGVLTEMNGQLTLLMEQLAALRKQYAYEIHDFEVCSLNGMPVRDVIYKQAIIKNLEINIEQKIADIEQQRKIIAEQTEVVIKATQDTKSIEKLKDGKRAKYDKAVSKENDLFIEEFVSNQTAVGKFL